MKSKVSFIARSENVLHPVSLRSEREISRAVDMTENHFFHAVAFKKLRKFGIGGFRRKGRVMNHGNKSVAFFLYFIRLSKTEFETLGFAAVQFFVVGSKIVTAGASPAARTDNYYITEFNAIVLQKIKGFVGS